MFEWGAYAKWAGFLLRTGVALLAWLFTCGVNGRESANPASVLYIVADSTRADLRSACLRPA